MSSSPRRDRLYTLRDTDEEDIGLVYGANSTIFTMKLHHGGYFTDSPGRKYLNGKVNYVDCIDSDTLSVNCVLDMIEDVGYPGKNIIILHFLRPNTCLDYGLEALGCDEDVLNLCKYVKDNKEIWVFAEHGKTTLYKHLSPRGVVIEEIVDDEVVPVKQVKLKVRKPCVQKKLLLNWIEGEGEPSSVNVQNTVKPVDGPVIVEQTTDETAADDVSDVDVEVVDDDSDDDERIVDEDFPVQDVEVDMRSFKCPFEDNTGSNGHNTNETSFDDEDLNVVDNDEFSSDDELGEGVRHKKLKELRKQQSASCDLTKTHFYVGQKFATRKDIIKYINLHAIETRRNLKILYNDKVRVRACCLGLVSKTVVEKVKAGIIKDVVGEKVKYGDHKKVKSKKESLSGSHVGEIKQDKTQTTPQELKVPEKCEWKIHCSKAGKSETWQVKTLTDIHSCQQSRVINQCNSGFISSTIVDQLSTNPKLPTKAVKSQCESKFEVEVPYMKAYRGLKKAQAIITGDYVAQYKDLRDYLVELMRCNEDTTVKVETEHGDPDAPTKVFKRVYICLGPLKQGFRALGRDIIGVDGSFMKEPAYGEILTAVGLDSNNGIYPVAYALVENENYGSWCWFLDLLGQDLQIGPMSNFTFISDRQKGLIEAIKKYFPVAEHRYCLRHLQQNMRKTWTGTAYKNHLWNCATALTVPEFDEAMQKLKGFSEPCYVWLSKVPPKHWARSHFTGRAKSDILLNNICEVFNRWLVDARDKPIITALEYIREYCMKRIVKVKTVIAKCEGPLTPTATKLFEQIKKDASKYHVLWNGGNKYQVNNAQGDQCVVDVALRTCGCKRWQLTGMACKHAVATFWNMEKHNQDVGVPEVWVDPVYWLETWVNTYNHIINPVNGRSKWVKSTETTTLTAPIRKARPGRPKKNRRKEMDERQSLSQGGKLTRAGKSLTCGKCKEIGHNRRSCDLNDGASTSKAAKRKKNDGACTSKAAKRKKNDGASVAGSKKNKKNSSEGGS